MSMRGPAGGGGSAAAQSITKAQLTDINRLGGFAPTGALAENFSRLLITTNVSPVSGTLLLGGGLVLPAGRAVNSMTLYAAGAVVTPTHQWFCLVDGSLNVLAKTVDDTTAAWAANAAKTLALSAPFTPSSDIAVYAGVLVAAATTTSLRAGQTFAPADSATPPFGATSTTGLTTPASLGATAAALNSTGAAFYCYVS